MINNLEQFYYLGERKMATAIGSSKEFLKKCRTQNVLVEGTHWVRLNSRVMYNVPLLLDWIHNQSDPVAHERAIANYLANLPCNQRKIRQSSSGRGK